MSILTSLLYGSRARGDETASSDTDLLMITGSEPISHTSVNGISISYYPIGDLTERAERGDLFLYHIIREGMILYDPDDLLNFLKQKFKLRKSYDLDISWASDLAWLIIKCLPFVRKSKLTGRRIAWCVRTIIIAKSSEMGRPIFSAREMAGFASSFEILNLINQKNISDSSDKVIIQFENFIEGFAYSDPFPNSSNIEDYRERFMQTNNTIGVSFLSSVDYEFEMFDYS